MKALNELQLEIEMGLQVYSSQPGISICKSGGSYVVTIIGASGQLLLVEGFPTFDNLISLSFIEKEGWGTTRPGTVAPGPLL